MRRSRVLASAAGGALAAMLFLDARQLAAAPAAVPDVADALVQEADSGQAAVGDEAKLARLRLAFEAGGRPGHGLSLARALAGSRQLLAALAVYRQVASGAGSRGTPADLDAAQAAASEGDSLAQRIPRVRLRAPLGATVEQLQVDGRSVAVDAWLWLEPGEHQVQASAKGAPALQLTLTLTEAERRSVLLDFKPARPATDAPKSGDAPRKSAKPELAPTFKITHRPGQSTARRESSQQSRVIGSSQRMFGYLTIGWGVAGLLTGGVSLFLKSKESDPDKVSTLGTISTIGFAAGGGLTVLGIVLIATAPSRRAASLGSPLAFVDDAMGRSRQLSDMDVGVVVKGAF